MKKMMLGLLCMLGVANNMQAENFLSYLLRVLFGDDKQSTDYRSMADSPVAEGDNVTTRRINWTEYQKCIRKYELKGYSYDEAYRICGDLLNPVVKTSNRNAASQDHSAARR